MRGQSEDTAARPRATLGLARSPPATRHAHTRQGPPYSVPRVGCGAHTQFDTASFRVTHNKLLVRVQLPARFAGSFLVERGDNQTNQTRPPDRHQA